MKKKDVLLVLVVILIPIVILGALGVMGTDNIKDSISFEGDEGAYTVYEYLPGNPNSDPPEPNSLVNITDGISLHKDTTITIVVSINDGYAGTPVLKIGDDVLQSEDPVTVGGTEYQFVYSVTVHEEPIIVTISGLSA